MRTPVPLAYAVHTSRLLSLWVGTLPFVLVGCFTSWRRLLTVPLTAFVAWALFCTEELGHIIEEPFGAFNEQARRTEVACRHGGGIEPANEFATLRATLRSCDPALMTLCGDSSQ